MYSTRSSRKRDAARVASTLDALDDRIVELASLEDTSKLKFARQDSGLFCVSETSIADVKVGDVLVSIGEIQVLDQQGGDGDNGAAVEELIKDNKTWPLLLNLKTKTRNSSLCTNKQRVPSSSSVKFLPQIPMSRTLAEPLIAYVEGTEVDLTLDDDEEDDNDSDKVKKIHEDNASTTITTTTTKKQWTKGQIVRTRYGVGSVFEDSKWPENPFVIVLLHWTDSAHDDEAGSQAVQSPLTEESLQEARDEGGLEKEEDDDDSSQAKKSKKRQKTTVEKNKSSPTLLTKSVFRPIAYLNLATESIQDCSDEKIMEYYSFSLTMSEFARFQPGMYLNDTLVDLFLFRFVQEILPKEIQSKVHVMNSHFYSKLEKKQFEGVKRWTRNVNVFDKEYLIIPVNHNNHWSLAIVCFLNRLIPTADSSSSASKVVELREYGEAAAPVEAYDPATHPSLEEVDSEPQDQVIPSFPTEFSDGGVTEMMLILQQQQQGAQRPKRDVKRAKTYQAEQQEEGHKRKPKKTSRPSSASPTTSQEDGGGEEEEPIPIPVILKLDSTKTHQSRDVAQNLRIWVANEWERKKPSADLPPIVVDAKTLPICPPPVPLQTNSCDCGVYLLHFAERFLLDRAGEQKKFECTQQDLKRKFSKQFGADWFDSEIIIPQKRREMAKFVQENRTM